MMSDQLANTVAIFEQWRSDKSSKSAATPIHLRQQAVALLPHYSKNTVATRLRIRGGQLKRWHLALQAPDEPNHFIQLPEPQVPPTSLSIEINLENGNQLFISGELNNLLITQVIEAIKS
jgi:hypothetical protein